MPLSEIFAAVDAQQQIKLSSLLQFLVVSSICAASLGLVYRRIASNSNDSNEFAATLFILTVAIGLLVSIIKQAPAISFGLFGAMSIVRFRAQIKKPRQMVFLFMATAIGVCCGAGEFLATVFGTFVLSVAALIMYRHVDGTETDAESDEPSASSNAAAPVAPEPPPLEPAPKIAPIEAHRNSLHTNRKNRRR